MMNYHNKTKQEVIKELHKLQKDYDLLNGQYLKEITGLRQTEEELRSDKNQFQLLFSKMLQGSALYEMIYDDQGKAVDYLTLDINKAFEIIMNVSREQVIGKLASTIIPDMELKKWLAIFAPVARGEGTKNYKQFSQLNNKYYEGVVFSSKPGQFWVTFNDFTNRGFAEEALQKSEEKWRRLVTTIPDYIVLHDLKGRYLFLNHYVEGFSENDILGKSVYDFLYEGSRKEYRKKFKACIKTLQTQKLIFSGFRNNRGLRFYECHMVPVMEKDQVANVMVISSDITERKQTEEAFHKLSLRHEAILAAVPEIIMEVDKNKIYTWANRAGLDFFGNDVIGKEASFYFKSEQDTYNLVKPLFDGGERIFYVESWQRRCDGKNRLLGWWCHVLKDSEGNVTGALSSARDITEQKMDEEIVRESEEKFRILVKSMGEGVGIIDSKENFIFANPAAEKIFGFGPGGLVGKNLKEFLSPVNQELITKQTGRRRKRISNSSEHEIILADGTIKQIIITATPKLGSNGEFLGTYAIFRDIAEYKKMEEKLLRSKGLMEKLNQHLNEVRENERAIISREIHDELGQSMTALKLDLNLMRQYVNTNSEAVSKLESMLELISKTIKNVQRISSELRPGILDDLGLVSAIEWYCDEFERRSGIKCKVQVDNSEFTDEKINLALFRVLQETLTNVIRHAMASAVSVELKKSNKETTLTILDNGIGMPEEKIKSHKSLGLISMSERVRQFGGKIEISSRKTKGTKLSVIIPEKKKKAS